MMTMTTTKPLWPHQQRGIDEAQALVNCGEQFICLTSPTGGGKSRIIEELIRWAVGQGWRVALYTHRQILRDQISDMLHGSGVSHGLTASGFEREPWKMVQVCMMQTVTRRLEHGHGIPEARLVLVDEAHDQCRGNAEKCLRLHTEHGASIIGVTATPVDVGHLYKSLVVAGTNSELRACGAHVWCDCYEPTIPDIHTELRRMKTGEFQYGDVVKAIMTPVIFGNVQDHWKKLNPDARPTILFAPGVKESIWFTSEFRKKGVRAAHICGESVIVDGVEHRSDKAARDQVLTDVKTGRIQIICNRFVLREGLDVPSLYHCILATCMGSLKSYVQSIGRLLRAHPSLDRVVCQDHGGNVMRHGSPNIDRIWDMGKTESQIAAERKELLKSEKEPSSIVCPECQFIRESGPVCPSCGFKHKHSCRRVMMRNGELKLLDESTASKPRKKEASPDKEWVKMYFIGRAKGWTFKKCAAIYKQNSGTWPKSEWGYVPKNRDDWSKAISTVQYKDLSSRRK